MEENTKPVENSTPEAQEEAKTTPAVDYDKLDQIISKRLSTAEKGVMKSFFEQQGLSEEEINEAINSYKSSKKEKAEQTKSKLTDLEKENATLKKAMQDKELASKTKEIANELGVDTKKLAYVLKVADMHDVFDEKGNVKEDVIKTSLSKVLEDLPEFKKQQEDNSKGGFKIGADTTGKEKQSDELSRIRKVMGL